MSYGIDQLVVLEFILADQRIILKIQQYILLKRSGNCLLKVITQQLAILMTLLPKNLIYHRI